jgi:SRSO17 transposase
VGDLDAREILQRFGTFADQFAGGFSRRPQREAASRYLDGLFSDSERKSMQAMHGRLSDPASYQALQQFITHSPWEAGPLWTRLRAVVPVRTGILAVDDTGLPKQGRQSVGVQRQYCGALGKIGNCQVAVSTVLAGERLAWPLPFELYLPQTWAADAERRTHAGVPERLRFREKWRIALSHVGRALKAGFTITAVVADADYGSTAAFRRGLEQLGLRYGVAIRGCVTVWSPGLAASVTRQRGGIGRARRGVGAGRVGHRHEGAARRPLRRVARAAGQERGRRWLLCERSLATDERK